MLLYVLLQLLLLRPIGSEDLLLEGQKFHWELADARRVVRNVVWLQVWFEGFEGREGGVTQSSYSAPHIHSLLRFSFPSLCVLPNLDHVLFTHREWWTRGAGEFSYTVARHFLRLELLILKV